MEKHDSHMKWATGLASCWALEDEGMLPTERAVESCQAFSFTYTQLLSLMLPWPENTALTPPLVVTPKQLPTDTLETSLCPSAPAHP